MQVIILAAGLGRRLGELTSNNTKCMVKVNGIRLIDRLLEQLSQLSLQRIVLVIGYEGKKLRDYLGTSYGDIPLVYVENPIYDQTNNIYSLALAKKELAEDDTLLVESDMIFCVDIFKRMIEDNRPNLAAVAKFESWMDGTVVLLDKDENIVNFIPKSAFDFNDISRYYKRSMYISSAKVFPKKNTSLFWKPIAKQWEIMSIMNPCSACWPCWTKPA